MTSETSSRSSRGTTAHPVLLRRALAVAAAALLAFGGAAVAAGAGATATASPGQPPHAHDAPFSFD